MIIDVTVVLLTATATATAVNDISVTVTLNNEVVNPEATFCERVDDCLDIPTANGSYVLKILNGVKSWIAESVSGGVWGSITGTLSDQTDLQNALNAKQNNLGYTPENVSNKSDSYTVSSSTTYASTKAVVDGLATKQDNLGYTSEDTSNKTSTIAGNESSTTLYPNVNGVVDWIKQGMTALLSSLSLTKTTPVDADSLLLNDSADSNKLKLVTWANIKATLLSYFSGYFLNARNAYLSGNATLFNTLTATDITGLSFSVEANSRYYLFGQVHCGSNNSSGIKWAFTAPTGSTIWFRNFGFTNAVTLFRNEPIFTSGTLTSNAIPAASVTQGFAEFVGTIETGANAGTLQLQWACGAGGYTITAYKDGTNLILVKL